MGRHERPAHRKHWRSPPDKDPALVTAVDQLREHVNHFETLRKFRGIDECTHLEVLFDGEGGKHISLRNITNAANKGMSLIFVMSSPATAHCLGEYSRAQNSFYKRRLPAPFHQ